MSDINNEIMEQELLEFNIVEEIPNASLMTSYPCLSTPTHDDEVSMEILNKFGDLHKQDSSVLDINKKFSSNTILSLTEGNDSKGSILVDQNRSILNVGKEINSYDLNSTIQNDVDDALGIVNTEKECVLEEVSAISDTRAVMSNNMNDLELSNLIVYGKHGFTNCIQQQINDNENNFCVESNVNLSSENLTENTMLVEIASSENISEPVLKPADLFHENVSVGSIEKSRSQSSDPSNKNRMFSDSLESAVFEVHNDALGNVLHFSPANIEFDDLPCSNSIIKIPIEILKESSSTEYVEENIESSSSEYVEVNIESGSTENLQEKIESSSSEYVEENIESSSLENVEEKIKSSSLENVEEKIESLSLEYVEENIESSSSEYVEENIESSSSENIDENIESSSSEYVEENIESSLENVEEKIESSSLENVEEKIESSLSEYVEENMESSSLENVEEKIKSSSLENVEEKIESSSLENVEEKRESLSSEYVEEKIESLSSEYGKENIESGSTENLKENIESSSLENVEEKITSSSLENVEEKIESLSSEYVEEKIESLSSEYVEENIESSSLENVEEKIESSSLENVEEKRESLSSEYVEEKIESLSSEYGEENIESGSTENIEKKIESSSLENVEEKIESSSLENVEEKIESSSTENVEENIESCSTKNVKGNMKSSLLEKVEEKIESSSSEKVKKNLKSSSSENGNIHTDFNLRSIQNCKQKNGLNSTEGNINTSNCSIDKILRKPDNVNHSSKRISFSLEANNSLRQSSNENNYRTVVNLKRVKIPKHFNDKKTVLNESNRVIEIETPAKNEVISNLKCEEQKSSILECTKMSSSDESNKPIEKNSLNLNGLNGIRNKFVNSTIQGASEFADASRSEKIKKYKNKNSFDFACENLMMALKKTHATPERVNASASLKKVKKNMESHNKNLKKPKSKILKSCKLPERKEFLIENCLPTLFQPNVVLTDLQDKSCISRRSFGSNKKHLLKFKNFSKSSLFKKTFQPIIVLKKVGNKAQFDNKRKRPRPKLSEEIEIMKTNENEIRKSSRSRKPTYKGKRVEEKENLKDFSSGKKSSFPQNNNKRKLSRSTSSNNKKVAKTNENEIEKKKLAKNNENEIKKIGLHHKPTSKAKIVDRKINLNDFSFAKHPSFQPYVLVKKLNIGQLNKRELMKLVGETSASINVSLRKIVHRHAMKRKLWWNKLEGMKLAHPIVLLKKIDDYIAQKVISSFKRQNLKYQRNVLEKPPSIRNPLGDLNLKTRKRKLPSRFQDYSMD